MICNVTICENNNNKKCTFDGEIVLDYYGTDAMPTCLNFKINKDKIQSDTWGVSNLIFGR